MNIDWILIRRSIDGPLTEQERAELNEWMDGSPQNRAFYEDVCAHYARGGQADISEEKINRYKKDFESRLAAKIARRRGKSPRRLMKVAAAVLLPLMAAGGFLWYISGRQEIKEQPVIEPGVVKALVYNMETGRQAVVTRSDSDTLNRDKARNIENTVRYNTPDQDDTAPTTLKIVIPRGAEYTLEMYDGTIVHLNSSSELTYNTNPNSPERRVELKGEAYFDVSANPGKPFVVTAGETEVKVYGTRFNVNTRSRKFIQTIVEQGSVSVRAGGDAEKMLRPGEMGQYDRTTGKIEISQVNINHALSWQSGIYIFENKTIEDIMGELSIWYDVEVAYPNASARLQRFSGSLPRNRELSELLRLMEKTSRVNFEINGRTVVVE